MTTQRYKRCVHCRSPYLYQGSGYGCGNPLNDDRYCRECQAVVLEALRKVPVRFQCRYFPIAEVPEYADVTRAQVEVWEAVGSERRRKSMSIVPQPQRIWPGLMDLENGDHQSIRQVVATSGPHEGTPFRVSSWQVRPDYLVEVPLAWDVLDGKRGGLWRD